MDKYNIVTTFCDKEEVANEIINSLLEKRLVAKVHSKYWWNNKLEEFDEYKLEFRTKDSLFEKIKKEIKEIHDYEVAEISCYEINNVSKKLLQWIEENTQQCNRI